MIRLLRLLPILLCFLGSCEKREALTSISAREKILIKANGSEPRSLDLHLIQTVTEHQLMMAMFEGLVNEDKSDDTKVLPGVAETWESLDGAARWIFHLRANAKWSDGTPLVAADFVKTYQRQLTPKFGALYPEMLYKLKNAEEYHKGTLEDFSQVGVKALDDHTLELTLNGPTPYLPNVLQHFTYFPLPLHVISKYGAEGQSVSDAIISRFNTWTRPGHMVGNGAFKLKTWRFKDSIEMDRNPYYWDSANVKLNGLRFLVVPDLATEERLFRSGRVHITEALALDRIDFYKKKCPEVLQISPYLGVYFYRINVTRDALKDLRVRQALNLAIDRETLVNQTLHGAHAPALGFTPPMQAPYELPRTLSYNPEKARQLLAEAGYPNGKGFPQSKLLVNDVETHVLIAQVMQDMWKRNLNLDIGVRTEPSNSFYDTQNRMDYDLARAGWIADFVEPISFLDMWTTGNQNNNTGWTNPKFDELIRESYTKSGEERGKVLLAAETMFINDLPVIPIYWYNKQTLVHPGVIGWDKKVLDNHPWKDLDLKDVPLPDIR